MDPKSFSGAVELLVLEVLSGGPSYGYEIAQTVLSRSQDRFEMKEGSLYPALHKLEREKLLTSYWEEAEGRRRKYYRMTAAGQKALAQRKQLWWDFAAGLNAVLGGNRRGLLPDAGEF